ncbi:hypothetical protein D7V86_00645 [bacterium D16-51]|nr:hypothetical protein D7V96_04680 [bacterium D16-59]RKI62743.1 hypothetical protein D7V86_00645 [bacterium D16-51]
MKEEQISDALNLLDNTFIGETDGLRNRQKKVQKGVMFSKIFSAAGGYWKWAVAGICIITAVIAGRRMLMLKPANVNQSVQEEKLPMLSVTENSSDGMGFEGFWAYDISELTNNNPWNEERQPSTLPVFKNRLSYDNDFIVSGADFGKMRELLLEIAGRLGLDAASLEIKDDAPDEAVKQEITEKMEGDVPEGYFNPTKLIAKADGMEIAVDQTMQAAVSFEPALKLPDRYNFRYSASYEETVSGAEYLLRQYKDLLCMEDPQINIFYGDYSKYETGYQQEYQISFYDAGKNNIEGIVNYNFRKAKFDCDDNGELFQVRLCQTDLSQKMGDYPVIKAEDAKKLLLEGHYITTVPYKIPGEKFVARAELVYRTGAREEYFMPYYCFYVELPEEERDGIKTYGAYYVPAVEGKYLSNMPLWDGSFN